MTTGVPTLNPGERMAVARKRAHKTQAEMAELMEVSPGAIAQWETNRAQPRRLRERMRRWAELTGADYTWLMTGYAAWDSNPQPTDSGVPPGQGRLWEPDDLPHVGWCEQPARNGEAELRAA